MKNSIKIIGLLLCCYAFAGCNKDDIDTYSVSDSSAYFDKRNVEYSFIDTPEAEYADVEVAVAVTGPVADYDREVAVEVIADNTNVDASKYQILSGVVKAGKTSGSINMRLYNDATLTDATYELGLKLVDTKDFSIDLQDGQAVSGSTIVINNETIVSWNNQIARPKWLLQGNFLRYVTYTSLYGDAEGNVYSEQDATGSRLLLSSTYRSNGIYSRAFMLILREIWPEIVNVNGMYGTDADTLEKYPMVNVNMGGYSKVLMHKLETYVSEYNAAHPDAPLRHSEDAVILNAKGDIVTVSKNGVSYLLKVKNCPLIRVNPYNL